MTEDLNLLLDALDELSESESTGIGVFCQSEFFVGMKTFAKGLPDYDGTLVKFELGDKDGQKEASRQIIELLKNNDVDPTGNNTRPTKVVGFDLFQETAFGKSWSQDLQKIVATWTDAYTKVVRPALKELATAGKFKGFGKKYWAHFSLTPDPSGRVEKDENGNPKLDDEGREIPIMVWYPNEIYASKAECEKAAAEAQANAPQASSSGDNGDVPGGYTAELWATYKPQVIEARDKISGPPPVRKTELEKLAKDYALTVDFIESL